MNRFCAAVALCAAAATAVTAEMGTPRTQCVADSGGVVSGTIVGYAQGKGVYVALYATEEDFAGEQFCRNARFAGDSLPRDTIRFMFASLPPGDYLVASYQDTDGNKTFTKGLFGMPKEPYRIHRPNYGMFGPKFDACSFEVGTDTVRIVLDYSKGSK